MFFNVTCKYIVYLTLLLLIMKTLEIHYLKRNTYKAQKSIKVVSTDV